MNTRAIYVTLFMARSGSKFLRSLLNQHPQFHDHGECFHNREKTFPGGTDQVYRKLLEISLGSQGVSGFQFRYPRHVREFPEVFQLFSEYPAGFKFILLKRFNKLKGAISQQNAEKLKKTTGKAHLFRDSSSQCIVGMELNVERAVKEALDREQLDQKYTAWAKARYDTLEIYYESLALAPHETLNQILDFVGLSPLQRDQIQQSNFIKVTSDNLSEVVANYDELEVAVRNINRPQWLEAASFVEAEKTMPSAPAVLENSVSGKVLFNAEFKLENGGALHIKAERQPLKTNTMFLEDARARDLTGRVFASGEGSIFESPNGDTWSSVFSGQKFRKMFTLAHGTHLLQGMSGDIHRFDRNWEFLDTVKTGEHPWHGSWSIDECPRTGTVLWCEYPYTAEKVRVWRSVDSGASWSVVLELDGHPSDPKAGTIRHFHVVQKCTSFPNRWYLSSGDTAPQSRFWYSDDNGLTWNELDCHVEDADQSRRIRPDLLRKVYRFTSLVQTSDTLFWATDETFNGSGALFCAMNKNSLGVVRVAHGHCGFNEIRNVIQIDDRYALAFSEAKRVLEDVTVSLLDLSNEAVRLRFNIRNRRGTKSNFMNGLSSHRAIDGVFFSYTENKVIYPAPMTVKWYAKVRG